ncbi:pentatricopeptide repeat-containing protein At3g47530 [Andrographis paniculata]|uniref:pentatricopeptide repeat-containing protein At3g47530 n=1 Tax=Andrographis paniculata TaxID=175694 RepID=UPI0021E7FAC3|nr:pentatricopeptide repeat-containing protein At3g47530 [Andrographis paniculata]
MNSFHEEKAIISLIKSCSSKSHLLQLHSRLLRSSHFFTPPIFLSFLSRIALPPFRDLPYSAAVFSTFPAPSLSAYNTMIRAHSLTRGSGRGGLRLYQELHRSGFSSDALTATFALKCCAKAESFSLGAQIHTKIWKDGCSSDGLLLTTLMDFYSCLGKGGDAWKVFDEMPQRDVVAWNVLISCCTRNGRTRDALALFDRMKSSNESPPDDVTCLLALHACGSLNTLEFGEEIHRYIVENGFHSSKSVCNSLIAMYSRCGNVEKAFEVFDQMANRDVVSWTSMISGLATNGYGADAVAAFWKMQRENVLPDDQTFTGVLSGCSHAGLVDEGRMIFASMERDFGVTPNVHHYGCMVDLLGRAGFLDEAYGLVNSMKIKPDTAMWRTLLGACRIHRHVSLGEKVIDHLVEVKGLEAGDYILLSNIYLSIGNMEKVLEIRKMMNDRGIETTPAASSIELNRKLHEFLADDVSHPKINEIYRMLDEINQQLRIAGYVVEATSEFNTGESNSTPYRMSYHSEKLAIAFGVLSTPPGTTIRVAKDLRICVDCHNFAKILSTVYDRKVVVRDRSRFHHFRDGRCSCNDYW